MAKRMDEVTVIGGGVIGLSVAYELLRRGRATRVLDRGDADGVATSAAAGMLAPVSEVEVEDEAVLELGLDSHDRYPEFVRSLEALTGLSCGYRTDGTLWVALNRDDEGDLEHLRETVALRFPTLPARWLGTEEVLELEPHLSGRVLGGLLMEKDLQVDPRRLVRALRAAIRKLGGAVESGVRIESVTPRGGGRHALERSGPGGRGPEWLCGDVVIAAGAWSTSDIRSPISGAEARPVKGQILRLKGARLLDHVVRHPEVYLVPRTDGEIVVGATMEEMGFDTSTTAGASHDLLRRALQLLPGAYDLELAETTVGFRPAVRDGRPVIGSGGADRLYAAFGHARHGILLAPATAHYLSELITGDRMPAALQPFDVARDGARRGAGSR